MSREDDHLSLVYRSSQRAADCVNGIVANSFAIHQHVRVPLLQPPPGSDKIVPHSPCHHHCNTAYTEVRGSALITAIKRSHGLEIRG